MPTTSATPVEVELFSLQYAQYCGDEDKPLQISRSAAGYYLGVFDDQEGPICRDSVEYWASRSDAEHALATGEWTQRMHA